MLWVVDLLTIVICYRLADRYVSVNWDVNELLEKKEAIVNGNLLQVKLRL